MMMMMMQQQENELHKLPLAILVRYVIFVLGKCAWMLREETKREMAQFVCFLIRLLFCAHLYSTSLGRANTSFWFLTNILLTTDKWVVFF